MKIGIASDHRGIQLKTRLTQLLQSLECEVRDFGPHEVQSVDYPDYAAQLLRIVRSGHILAVKITESHRSRTIGRPPSRPSHISTVRHNLCRLLDIPRPNKFP